MIRAFCDICDQETDQPSQPEHRVFLSSASRGSYVGVKILRSIDDTWNAGHLCKDCLNAALEKVIGGDTA